MDLGSGRIQSGNLYSSVISQKSAHLTTCIENQEAVVRGCTPKLALHQFVHLSLPPCDARGPKNFESKISPQYLSETINVPPKKPSHHQGRSKNLPFR